MSWRMYLALAIAMAAVVSGGDPAFAVGWPVAPGTAPCLGFAASYQRPDGTAATHSGIDVPAEPGSSVFSVDAGTVTFAGRIPSATGGTMLAVTIESSTGARWSYMPLADVCVAAGQAMNCGDTIGAVAATGDSSSGVPHIHVGLRQGELYIDPLSVMVVPCAEAEAGDEAAQTEPTAEPVETPEVAPSEVLPQSAVEGQGVETEVPQPTATPMTVSEASVPVPDAPPATTGSLARECGVSTGCEETEASSILLGSAGTQDAAGTVYAAGFARTHVRETAHPWLSQSSAPPGTSFGWRLALAVLGLGPAVGAAFIRWFRSRITAPGNAVAAVVGR